VQVPLLGLLPAEHESAPGRIRVEAVGIVLERVVGSEHVIGRGDLLGLKLKVDLGGLPLLPVVDDFQDGH